MIVITYPGAGKTINAHNKERTNEIDLNCSLFYKENNKNWFVGYCNFAIYLSNKGNTVYVSSHTEVINYLITNKSKINDNKLYIIYPSLSIKQEWINKLKDRYLETEYIEDYYTYNYVNRNYVKDIELLTERFDVDSPDNNVYSFEIIDKNYNPVTLFTIINNLNNRNSSELNTEANSHKSTNIIYTEDICNW